MLLSSNKNSADKIRAFDDAGWSPYEATIVPATLNCIQTMNSSFPKALLRDVPLFTQIDFTQAKKVIYIVVMDHNAVSTTPKMTDRYFGISYRDIRGRVVAYGESKSYAEVFPFVMYTFEYPFSLNLIA